MCAVGDVRKVLDYFKLQTFTESREVRETVPDLLRWRAMVLPQDVKPNYQTEPELFMLKMQNCRKKNPPLPFLPSSLICMRALLVIPPL